MHTRILHVQRTYEINNSPTQGVGEGSTVKGAVIDMDASIGPGSFITNADRVQEADRSDQGFIIQQGLVTVLRNAALAPGTRI